MPVSANTNIYYVYYYFDNFEIFNLSALVPKQIIIMQFKPYYNVSRGYTITWWTSPGVPTQYLHIHTFSKDNKSYFAVNFTYDNTTVNVNGAEWVHNLVGQTSGPNAGKYVPENVIDSALTTPLLPAPSTPEITQAYDPTTSYTVNEYPSGSFQYTPYYLNFPATGYGGLPSYFGKYSLPAYGVTVGSTTQLLYATGWLGDLDGYTYGYIADTVCGNFSKPITSFELWITPNLYLWDAGLIQGALQQPGSTTWEAYYGVPISDWQLVDYMPVYVVVPAETQLLSAY